MVHMKKGQNCSHEERAELVKDMMKDNKITLLQERLQEIKEEMNE